MYPGFHAVAQPDKPAVIMGRTGEISTARQAATATAMLALIPGCPLRLMMDGAAAGFESYEDALRGYPPEPLADQPRGDVMQYTAGTTGQPKGVMRPLSGLQIDDPAAVGVSLLERMKLPEQVRRGYDLSSLQCVVHAAAPCPAEVKRRVIDWLGPIVSEYYAGSEGCGLTFISAAEWLEHPGSVGRAILGIPRVCGEDGAELPAGEPGLVYFERERSPFEYHGDPGKTRGSHHPAHPAWSTFGDVGYLDSGGYLYLTDRLAFTIISGGVNIYPAEIESCLIMHPEVADVAVFGLPDPEMGEYVHAVVQPADGVDDSIELAEELRSYARARLAGYKVPRVVDFRAELPRAATGKLHKGQLRAEYLAAQA